MADDPVSTVQYGARRLQTGGPFTVERGGQPKVLIGQDLKRRLIQVDNEGTVDLFVSEDDATSGGTLAGTPPTFVPGGVKIAAGASRTFRTTERLRVFVPSAALDVGIYRFQVETDS